jgi:hypothetical protein
VFPKGTPARETLLQSKKYVFMPERYLSFNICPCQNLYSWAIKKAIKPYFQPDLADHQFLGPIA